ncbi:MFS transporter, partial [Liquorilactobacillus vini]|uniref:MFS transporter n=1 Tax=Liquorilactobacillus vini TaxID=238015 RepID=UPI0011461AAF
CFIVSTAKKLGTVLGIIGLVIMFAPALGPTISGVILQNLSWRWIFWLFLSNFGGSLDFDSFNSAKFDFSN